MPEGECGAQEHFGALEQNAVPEAENGGLRQTRREQREQPLHREHVRQRRLVRIACAPDRIENM